ncbi:hypothetical protein [Kandleria sp.]|uniref:hypothetical protein n=1 Tax=Kandleria sp. TaxID=2774291 RepID=UPI001B420F5B|nr:hypothetical protein [Kandleria sp.]MBP3275666.1 hypothetical protein [Kandleria sp.]
MSKREEFGKYFIVFIFTLWSGTEVLFSSTLERFLWWNTSDINDQMAVIILGLLLAQIVLFQKYQFHELVVIGMISLPIIIATLNSNHNRMMSTWIFIVAAKYIDFDKIVKLTYYVELIMTLIVIYLFQTGVITELTMYRGSMVRHSLGFIHPNQLGMRIFLLVVCRCYIRRDKFNIIDWGIIIAAAVFVERVANSKTSYFSLVTFAIIMAAYEITRSLGVKQEVYSNMMIVTAVICNAASIILSFMNLSKYPFLKMIDVFMSKRFSQCHRTLKYYGIKILGQEIKLIVTRPGVGKTYRFWLDNAYMSILLRYGLIVFFFFSILYIIAMIYLKQNNRHLLVAILCLYAIYGLMENNFFSMSNNLFLLTLSYPIYSKNIHVEEKNIAKVKLVF